jgi:nucleoside-diphosphate-sugar epimerase
VQSINKKILIVGGTGFIGYHIIKKCLKNSNNKVYSLSLLPPTKNKFLAKVIYLKGDIKNFANLKKILKNMNFDYVVNCGGYIEHNDKSKIYKTHYVGPVNLYNVFKDTKIKCFIQIGSSSEYGKIKSPQKENAKCIPKGYYGRFKLKATRFLLNKFRQHKFPVIILRFYQVYGPKQNNKRFIPQLLNACIKNEEFPSSKGDQKRDFLYVEDAVNAVIACFENNRCLGKIINIASGKPIELRKIVYALIKKIKGGKPLFGKLKMRLDEQLIVYPDIFKSKKYLNWKPNINFNIGINKTIKEYTKEIKDTKQI